jgi:alpha-1,3-rhamnosyl/mannosyltransferase
MKVGIDGKSLLPPRAGVARYLEGLLAGCDSQPHPDVTLEIVSPRQPGRTLPWVLGSMQLASGRGFDLLHFPFYYPPLAPRCPVTVAIHDVLVLEHPEWFPRAWASPLRVLLPHGARRAAAVLTGSRHVADSISALCGVPRERIHLTGYGVDAQRFRPPAPSRVTDVARRLALTRPYLLLVGALEPRRGVDLALEATAALRSRFSDLELVLVGEVRAPVAGLTAPPAWTRRLGRVDDADLPALFAGAAAVLAPSRGEGFDLPLLEALSCGGVVVASDIPVHGEHFAPAVEMFASGMAQDLERAVATVLEDSGRAAALRTSGPALAADFRWDEVARRHLEVWRTVGRR